MSRREDEIDHPWPAIATLSRAPLPAEQTVRRGLTEVKAGALVSVKYQPRGRRRGAVVVSAPTIGIVAEGTVVWLTTSDQRQGRAGAGAGACSWRHALRACCLAVAMAAAAPGTHGAADASDPVVAQKLRLLEAYLGSPTAQRIVDGGNPQAMAELSRASGLVVDARNALTAGDVQQARVLADDALRTFSAASKMSAQPAATSAREHARYDELREAIGTFRSSLENTRETTTTGAVSGLDLATLDAEMARAEALAQGGFYDRANALLAELYQGTMQAIADARGSETVYYRLEFETPADELAYERERFRGNELLVDMLQGGGASDSAKRLAERYVAQARERRDAAQAMADAGDVAGAITAMEDASAMLGRAMGTLGLPMAR